VQKFIKEGNSFPKSASLAFQSLNLNGDIIDLSLPNNILGYHYVKAIIEQNARIKPKTITRTGANYHDEVFNSPTIASATSIRKALFSLDGTINEIQNFVPTSTYSTLEQYISNYGQLHQWENYFHLLKYKLLTTTPSELEGLYEMEEGLEYRFISNVKDSVTFNDFMEKMKTKRYTWTRLQRACTHVLTHTSKDVMRSVSKQKKASYIRLLGMSQNGRKYLNKVKKDLPVPVISKLSNSVDDMLSLDIKAANTYAMGFPEPIRSEWLRIEYSTPPIQYDEQEKLFL
jgi:predicted nucleotidyltransferase